MVKKIKIFDTLKGELVDFEPIEKNHVRMYVCGPTIYNLIHIGNARPMIVFDAFRRFLEYIGYKVTMVQNFTDIDDKIINKANEEGVPFKEIAERYIVEYWKDSYNLRIRAANFHPKTSNYVDEIIEFIQDLIDKGFAYESDGDVYFNVSKFEKYGELSHRNPEDMIAGSRIEISDKKQNPLDFTLWKKAKEGEPYWESPWGKGRPGWHIECSVMSNCLLGESFDIHAGGNDLIFPHHENEKAQSEARHGKTFAKYWMHNGMIKFSGEKMSKSIGNIWLVRELVKAYDPDTIKTFILSKHYRTPLDFTEEGLNAQKKSTKRVNEALKAVEEKYEGNVPYIPKSEYMKEKINEFIDYLSTDFNTPKAIALIFEITNELNKALTENNEQKILENYHLIRNEFGPVLGIFELPTKEEKSAKAEELINVLIDVRNMLRKEKNFQLSDYIRDTLKNIGITLKDTPNGTTFTID
nr:cysteine--tRNA ligase [Marinitoga sp. 1137]